MAGLNDNTVVAVIGNLSDEQSAQMTKEITLAKKRNAPQERGTIAVGKKEDVGRLIQTGYAKGIEEKGAKKVRKTRSDCTVGAFEKKNGLPPGTIRNSNGRDTRSDKQIGTIRKEYEKNGGH